MNKFLIITTYGVHVVKKFKINQMGLVYLNGFIPLSLIESIERI